MTDLTLAYDPDFAPLTFAEGGKCRGLVIDILAGLFDDSGTEVVFTALPLPKHDEAVTAGTVDGIAFKAVIAGRDAAYAFSDPILTTGAAWFRLPATSFDEGGPSPDARLTTPVRGPLAAQIKTAYPDNPFVTVESYAEALAAVIEDRADDAALNYHIGCHLAGELYPGAFALPDAPYQAMPVALALAAGRFDDLLNQLNPVIGRLQESGRIDALEKQWLSR